MLPAAVSTVTIPAPAFFITNILPVIPTGLGNVTVNVPEVASIV